MKFSHAKLGYIHLITNSKNSNIMKYYYSLTQLVSISLYIFIYLFDGNAAL